MFIKFRLKRLIERLKKNPLIFLKAFNIFKLKREIFNLFNMQTNFKNLKLKDQVDILFYTIKKLKQINKLGNNNHTKIFSENSLEEFFLKYKNNPDCEKFTSLFSKYGSDKTISKMSYLYWKIINSLEIKNLFEVGIGTNNILIPSNMGIDGKPGASLRAFEEYLKSTNIFGGDIDKNILFKTDRIKTFYIDQLDLENLKKIKNIIPKQSLIIDDGLGRPNSNLNMIYTYSDHLEVGGFMVIEHIDPIFRDVYETCIFNLTKNNNYNAQIIEGHGITFIIKRLV
tara:strand:- start:7916 stop:8767 length:852 start_codon:yes stop_codon:yes gene_type:complete